jgi:hypothetical protein
MRRAGNAFAILDGGHNVRKRVTASLEPWKIPKVRKITALLRLDGLNGTIRTVEKNALTIWFLLQRQATAIRAQAGEALDEIVLGKVEKRSETRNLGFRQAHLSRPAAAGGAALALVKNWHARKASAKSRPRQAAYSERLWAAIKQVQRENFKPQKPNSK